MDKLFVSCNSRTTDHVLFKIDQTAMVNKKELSDGYIFLESFPSAQWSQEQHSIIAENAIEFICKVIITPHDQKDTFFPDEIMETIMESMFGTPWPKAFHQQRSFD